MLEIAEGTIVPGDVETMNNASSVVMAANTCSTVNVVSYSLVLED